VFSSGPLFNATAATASSPPVGAPALVQHISSSVSGLPGVSDNPGNAFKCPIVTSVGAGNCIVLSCSYPHGATPTITDDNGNTWNSTPVVSADSGVGGMVAAIFVLPNANAGKTTLTVTFGADVQPFAAKITEWSGVATVSPVTGSHGANSVAGASLAAGAFTPTNNNANGGNLIFAYYACFSTSAGGNPTSWVPGGSFTLLDGDIGWQTNQGFPHASQFWLQTTAASVNPSITSTGDTADSFNCVAVALKASSAAGTPTPSGIHINKVLHFSTTSAPATWNLQTPTTGNLYVVVNVSNVGYTGITDSDGGTWVSVGSFGKMFYSINRTPNPNLIIHAAVDSSDQTQAYTSRFYDIQGAAASPFDTFAAYPLVDCSSTTVLNSGSITPTTSNGLVIAWAALGFGPGLGIGSGGPAGAWDLFTFTGELDGSLMEQANCEGAYYNPNTSPINWNWTITSIANNSSWGIAVSFKKA
jgi:hypothetical protein